jgi:ArsR family transcriptional regulator, nickel/cobalt-responsive transcriptional repressor
VNVTAKAATLHATCGGACVGGIGPGRADCEVCRNHDAGPGDACRLMILGRLRCAPQAVGKLSEDVAMEQSAVPHKSRLLRNLGLVERECQGRCIVYALNDDHVAQLLDQAVFHSEHLRLGAHDRPVAPAEASG